MTNVAQSADYSEEYMARQENFLTEIFVFKNKKHNSMNNKYLAGQLWHIKNQTFALC
jgi:hypothetical protein